MGSGEFSRGSGGDGPGELTTSRSAESRGVVRDGMAAAWHGGKQVCELGHSGLEFGPLRTETLTKR